MHDAEPRVGMAVCDCRFQHLTIIAVDADGDTITLSDGTRCSFRHCCGPAEHDDWEHPAGWPPNPAAEPPHRRTP